MWERLVYVPWHVCACQKTICWWVPSFDHVNSGINTDHRGCLQAPSPVLLSHWTQHFSHRGNHAADGTGLWALKAEPKVRLMCPWHWPTAESIPSFHISLLDITQSASLPISSYHVWTSVIYTLIEHSRLLLLFSKVRTEHCRELRAVLVSMSDFSSHQVPITAPVWLVQMRNIQAGERLQPHKQVGPA